MKNYTWFSQILGILLNCHFDRAHWIDFKYLLIGTNKYYFIVKFEDFFL